MTARTDRGTLFLRWLAVVYLPIGLLAVLLLLMAAGALPGWALPLLIVLAAWAVPAGGLLQERRRLATGRPAGRPRHPGRSGARGARIHSGLRAYADSVLAPFVARGPARPVRRRPARSAPGRRPPAPGPEAPSGVTSARAEGWRDEWAADDAAGRRRTAGAGPSRRVAAPPREPASGARDFGEEPETFGPRSSLRRLVLGIASLGAVGLGGAALIWFGVERLSSAEGPAMVVAGAFLVLLGVFAPAFKLVDLVLRALHRLVSRRRSPVG